MKEFYKNNCDMSRFEPGAPREGQEDCDDREERRDDHGFDDMEEDNYLAEEDLLQDLNDFLGAESDSSIDLSDSEPAADEAPSNKISKIASDCRNGFLLYGPGDRALNTVCAVGVAAALDSMDGYYDRKARSLAPHLGQVTQDEIAHVRNTLRMLRAGERRDARMQPNRAEDSGTGSSDDMSYSSDTPSTSTPARKRISST